tara:strand:- start:2544 stop:2762 length:219 start_codon:yes stop_codon:yes gene_type:complete
MPRFTLNLTPTQANALRDIMAINHIPGDIALSPLFEELNRYLDAMDDYAAEAAFCLEDLDYAMATSPAEAPF